jgi:hypothetical protein
MLKIEVRGQKKAVAKAELLLKTLKDVEHMEEGAARLKLQELVDDNNIKATILVNGNSVWSMKRILMNLNRIVAVGRLYGEKRPYRELIGGIIYLPVETDPILSNYYYEFLNLQCGSIAHYNIHGWIAEYPTLEHLKKFFKKNEFDKRVLDHIPLWYTDARRIVEAIEIQLYPLESYVKARKGSFSNFGVIECLQ